MTTPPAAQTVLTALELARAGRFAELKEMFTAQLRPMVAPEALRAGWEAELRRQGSISSIGAPVTEPADNGVVVVKILVSCARGAFGVVASVTGQGELAALQLTPPSATQPVAPWEPPEYTDPDALDEQDVTLGVGPLAVSGALTLPRDSEPRTRHPGVVLLAGSGPLDRDETIGRNKPFKDIAWGLATRGAAVLRFDKVTYAHPREARQARDFTLNDEYLPHALAAIELLQDNPNVDSGRVFLLGHSLGGTVAPRIAAAEPSVTGLIVLAGGAEPLHWALVRQVRYLASLDPETEAASRAAIEALTEKARLVDGPDLSLSTPADRLPLGTPASYWLDLRGYDPAATAAELGKPMLILQGGRDYQATVDDDLARWTAALGERPDVTVRVYPAHNHLFAPGRGPCTPAEYEPAQHVDPAVIADIADWMGDGA
ncbi:MAG TPA: alpha/beta fold hydrolase [Solirubrobacteraceae bacterium]|nr:alpha/beta fold hydrolase [Solirubrobacteraceae bacterium]